MKIYRREHLKIRNKIQNDKALMLYLTDFSTASKMLNLNNPIQETVRFRSVGSGITLLLSVPKGRDICECRKKSVICYIRANDKSFSIRLSKNL